VRTEVVDRGKKRLDGAMARMTFREHARSAVDVRDRERPELRPHGRSVRQRNATRQAAADMAVVPDPRRLLGDAGEDRVARELEARGVRVVARNARTRYGEIDLVGRDARGHVFVEVKTRRRGSFVSAAEAVDSRKLARLHSLALAWASDHRIRGRVRLVVAAVTVDDAGMSVDLIEVAD
jgi:putative endonuclease